MTTILLEIGYHTNIQSKHVLTFHTCLGKVSLGASSCWSKFLFLSPTSLQHHPSLSDNPRLYNFVSSLVQQGATHIQDVQHWQNMWRWQSQLVIFLGSHRQSWLVSQNVVIVHQPRSTGRASWKSQRKNQYLSFGAMHLTTTVTIPIESFTESVSNGLLSLFVLCVPSTHSTSGKAWKRRLPSGKTQQQPMSISWSSLAPTASLLSQAYFLKAEVSATSRGSGFSWKGEVSPV